MPENSTPEMSSNKPYIVRAFYHWITDNQLTPYISVDVNVYGVLVPMAYVNDGQIILNISTAAVGTLGLGADSIDFSARFGGKLEHISVPYGAVAAIYAKENGAGTSLPIEHPVEDDIELKPFSLKGLDSSSQSESDSADNPKKSRGKPTLKVIK